MTDCRMFVIEVKLKCHDNPTLIKDIGLQF